MTPETLTPAERFLVACLRAHQAWNADGAPQSALDPAVLDIARAIAKHGMLTSAGIVTPAGQELLARADAAERTPESVLRAMVHAYQDAAVEAEADVFREQRNGNASIFAQLRMFDTQKDAANMRAVAATYAAEGILMRWLSLHTDYEARLSGTVPIDAPPPKEPT